MVSNYKRKTDRGIYTREKLQEAVRAVKNGKLSGYKASQIYKIPRMTIMDHVNNKRFKSNTLGRSTALNLEIENKLAMCIRVMEKYGFGLTKKELVKLVGDYVNRNHLSTPFKNGLPGEAWFAAFTKRHNLSIKKPQGVEYARKKAMDPFIVYPYFDLLQNTLKELNLVDNPSAIWNIDETSFSKDPAKTKIIGAKGHAATRLISSPGRDNTTVLLGANALGEKIPPLIIYKGKNVWDAWTSADAYPGTTYAATKKGWMETDVFEMYFKKCFLPAVGDRRPILLIYDGHATHVGLNLIEEAIEAGITILKLPAHSSHILQPLDISIMKSFKDKWDPLLVKWQRMNVGASLPKNEFSHLIGQVWAQIDVQVIANGFRKAGIVPFNPNEIAEDRFDALQLKRWKELHDIESQNRNNESITNESVTHVSNMSGIVDDEENSTSHVVITKNEPKTLRSLTLDNINTIVAEIRNSSCGGHGNHGSALNCEINYQNEHSSLNYISNSYSLVDINENDIKPLLENKDLDQTKEKELPVPNKDSIQKQNKLSNKIQILENRLVTFEELLLMQVKSGSSLKAKRRKIAPGAEVITHDDVVKRKIQDKIKNIKQEKPNKRKMQKVTKTSIKTKKTSKLNKNGKRKTKFETSSNSTTEESISDDMSIYSDAEISDFDENIFMDLDCDSDGNDKNIVINESTGLPVNIIRTESKNVNAESKSKRQENKEFEGNSEAETENNETNETEDVYNIDDKVLVRYYNRKKWTYYIGYVDGINDSEKCISVRFYKTHKNPLRFLLSKKVDRDDVPTSSIVKKNKVKSGFE